MITQAQSKRPRELARVPKRGEGSGAQPARGRRDASGVLSRHNVGGRYPIEVKEGSASRLATLRGLRGDGGSGLADGGTFNASEGMTKPDSCH